MTSAQIRQSFLDFFREKKHTIVPSSSLLPDAPNLLFTNAGMNQFVPIFLGQQKPPWKPARVADTQKCIRAGGKHNDLEDVGLDTYHHTFFEMLGNWSFGDYFKKEAIEWAWELLVERWKFPAQRLYATVYKPGPGEPSEFDREAHDHWARLFQDADLDPKIHVVDGGKADNFWMMGDTGPCGPCSEVHVDLTPGGETPRPTTETGALPKFRSTSHSASSPITSARFHSRSLMELFRRTRDAVTFCGAFYDGLFVTAARLISTSHSSSNLSMSSPKQWATSFLKYATTNRRSKIRFPVKRNRLTRRWIQGYIG